MDYGGAVIDKTVQVGCSLDGLDYASKHSSRLESPAH